MKSLYQLAKSLGCTSNNRTDPDSLGYSNVKSGKQRAAIFTIGSKLMARMKWIAGDRVDVMYDQQLAEGQIIRCREGGWMLSGDDKKATAICRFRIHLKPEFGLPELDQKIDLAIELTDNTISFAFPTKYRKPLPVKAG